MELLEVAKNTCYGLANLFCKPISAIKKYYIRKRYALDINDLELFEKEQYEYSSTYITIPKSITSNYQKRRRMQYFDDKGIPRFRYKEELRYNPVQIIQHGLEEYGYYIANKNYNHLKNATRVGDWLIENIDSKSGAWYYVFNFVNPNIDYEIQAPWCSALAQGQGISLLCRLYCVDQKEIYKQIVELALKPFSLSVEKGGVLANFQGLKFYEEYPTNPQTYTLNGFMYSMFGLYDAYKTFKIVDAKELFDEAIVTLKTMLPLYDDSRLSYYDLSHFTGSPRKTVQNSKYHILHTKLLQGLMSIEPNKTFGFYIKRWKEIL